MSGVQTLTCLPNEQHRRVKACVVHTQQFWCPDRNDCVFVNVLIANGVCAGAQRLFMYRLHVCQWRGSRRRLFWSTRPITYIHIRTSRYCALLLSNCSHARALFPSATLLTRFNMLNFCKTYLCTFCVVLCSQTFESGPHSCYTCLTEINLYQNEGQKSLKYLNWYKRSLNY